MGIPVITEPSYSEEKKKEKKPNKIKFKKIKEQLQRTALNCQATLKQRNDSKIALSEIEHSR